MKELHPEIRKYWEDQGKVILTDENALYTQYYFKEQNGVIIPIAQGYKYGNGSSEDFYWVTTKINEKSYTLKKALKLIKLKVFW